jgi:hypothetical protein
MLEILNDQKAIYYSEFNREVIGFYILHDNFQGRGNHISNALYAIKKECNIELIYQFADIILLMPDFYYTKNI